jgi:DNA-binding protein YbaB
MSGLNNLDDLAGYALHQVDRLRHMQEQLAQISGEGRSANGHVIARTGAGGNLLKLTIDDAALRDGGHRLGEDVTAAVTAAQAAYAAQAGDLMAEEIGVRPGDPNSGFDRGLARIDELTDQLEDMTRRLQR